MLVTLNNSSHISKIGAEDFGHKMSLWPHAADRLDAIVEALQNSEKITWQRITIEKKSDPLGDYIALDLPINVKPHDVVDALLTAGIINQQDALLTKRPLDELMTRNAVIINVQAR